MKTTFLVCFALFAALVWFIVTHSGDAHSSAPSLTDAQAASQAAALAGQVAAANGNTAIYTPLLFAAAANLSAANASTNSAN